MKSFYFSLFTTGLALITVFPAHSQTSTDLPYPRCANNAETWGGEPDSSKKAGTCTFDAYTGNEYREVQDIEVWGGVGEMPLVWKRYGNSRFGFAKNPYGTAHAWTSSFIFIMSNRGQTQQGQSIIEVRFPDGAKMDFIQSINDPNLWLPPPAVPMRLHQEGTNLFLQTTDGFRYRFAKLISSGGTSYYRLQDFKDPYQNLYQLAYNSDARLMRVTEPAGRYLHITYTTISNNTVITKVQTSDGRSVNYHYKVIDDGLTSWVALDTVYYGDGTKAIYEYSQREPGVQPLLSHAIDPRVVGVGTNMKYAYRDDIDVTGMIYQEKNGVTNEVMATFIGGPVSNTVCYANGRYDSYDLPTAQRGQLNSFTDGLGRKNSFIYNDNGLGYLAKVVDALGRITVFNTKTIYNNPLEITYPDGSKRKWTRDNLDLVLTYTDELLRTTIYTRDSRHRITKITYPDGSSESFTHNDFGQILAHTLRNNGVERNAYNFRGLKTSFIDAMGNETKFVYDLADRLAAVTDARGNTTKYVYNERGLLTTFTNADGTTKNFSYDSFGNLIRSTNEIGKSWIIIYDEFKRLVSRTDPLNRTTKLSYDLPNSVGGSSHAINTPTKITLPSGKFTETEYDLEWERIRETVGAGTADAAITLYEYDLVGRLTSTIDPNGKEWRTQYDLRDRKSAAIDPLGNRTDWQYDAIGNVVKITRPDGGTILYLYDLMDRQIKATDPKGQSTLMSYDAEGNIIQITDPRNQSYRFQYDLLNRKTKLVYPDQLFEGYAYDAVGNLKTYTTRAKQIRTYDYDNRDREINSFWTSPYAGDITPAINKSYDAAGRLVTMNSSVSILSYTYSDANELISETQTIAGGGSKKLSYSYNKDGLRQSMTNPDGTVVQYSFTNRNQVASITSAGKNLANYTYDLNGNRTSKMLLNGTNAHSIYDAATNLLSIDQLKGTASFARFDYGYDNMDRRKFVKRNNNKGDVYSYDATDQVIKVLYEATNPNGAPTNPTRTVNYNWDPVGNRTSVVDNDIATSYSANNLNQYTTVGSQIPTYYMNANLKTYNGWTYGYDAQNRLIKVVKGTTIVSFAYDARNRCVKSTFNGVNTFLYYDEWDLVEERNSSGTLLTSYVHGAQVDEILTKVAINGSIKDTIMYHYDALGSVTHLTNTKGNIVEQYMYDIFGAPTIMNGAGAPIRTSAYNNRFLLTGREYIQEIALYDYRNRMYSAELGRFLQQDPLGFDAGDVNLFRYVNNNPVNWRDPLGYGFWSSFASGFVSGALTAAAVVVAAAVIVTAVPAAAAAVTATLFVAGTIGLASSIASIITNPTADNIGYNLGALTGAALVGGLSARAVATKLSPPGHQPPPGRAAWSLSRDLSQRWKSGGPEGTPSIYSLIKEFPAAMATGPNVPGAAGAITGTGGEGMNRIPEIYKWVITGGRPPRNRCK